MLETSGWAAEQVTRVNKALQRARPGKPRFDVHVPWISEETAFTAPGSHIFITRALLQLLRNDDQIAFIIAHEMAHHDLGHTNVFPEWFHEASPLEIQALAYQLYKVVNTLIHGAQTELEADVEALRLSTAAGFDPSTCIGAFDVMKKMALDRGAVTTTYGGYEPDQSRLTNRARQWLSARQSGYLSIVDRKARLEDLLSSWQEVEPAL